MMNRKIKRAMKRVMKEKYKITARTLKKNNCKNRMKAYNAKMKVTKNNIQIKTKCTQRITKI